jgi:hypothetical protein
LWKNRVGKARLNLRAPAGLPPGSARPRQETARTPPGHASLAAGNFFDVFLRLKIIINLVRLYDELGSFPGGQEGLPEKPWPSHRNDL